MSITKGPGYLGASLALALTALAAGILAPVQPASAASYVPIDGAGSTWSANAIDDWVTNEAGNGLVVNYAPAGSASGLQQFADELVDWGASDIPYGVDLGNAANPPPVRGYTYMPDTAGGIALVYNLHIDGQQVTNLRLSGAVIAGIFTNQITTWNDPRIAADNPGLTLPAEPIIPVVRTDVAGSTWAFTQWMSATQSSDWTAYCAVTDISPCTATTAYPVQAGTSMVSESGDLGVSGYVSQASAEGAIGYTEYSYALETGFPVANVLNAAGYYTAPTAQNIGVSLLDAQVNTDTSSVLYQTEELSGVYTDTDPRTYELSYYSYLILPTDLSSGFTTDKGYTLGAFGQYAMCQGQQQVDALGYAALPINLVEDGYAQLQRIPGNAVTSSATGFLSQCNNPTLSDGADILSSDAPMPPACDLQGATQCPAATSGGVSSTTTLTASPDPAGAGQPVTLTATVVTADGSAPAGSVQFQVGGTDIGSPVAVGAGGVATATTTFASVGTDNLAAVFTPTDPSYAGSIGTFSLTVETETAGTAPIVLTIPPSGGFTVTIPAGATVTLTQAGATASGALPDITVSDTRNTYPGWSVSGQESDFAGTGLVAPYAIPADNLGWLPAAVDPLTLPAGVSTGPQIAPETSPGGLGDTGGVLADATQGAGYGTYNFGATLTLDIPASAPAGTYTGSLTITYLETGP
jgi:phosphate ABC transporter phosphate-binding protein